MENRTFINHKSKHETNLFIGIFLTGTLAQGKTCDTVYTFDQVTESALLNS